MADESTQKVPLPDPKERTPTILIVDDEVLIRMAVSDFLQECGFKVLEAGTAAEAIEMIQSNQSTLDIVFSDIRMPGEMDGFGLSKWIRQNRPGLPVILASGDAKKSDAAHELCAEEPFLRKPYDLQFVVAQIRQTLETRKKSS
ncbi:MAG TPA: response regulator [Steroidobacteraceae bacterium]